MPVEKNNQDKIQVILDYLTLEFPEGFIEHKYVSSRSADIIFLSLKSHQTQINISNEFLEANNLYNIKSKLIDFLVANFIRKKKPAHITLTNSGLK